MGAQLHWNALLPEQPSSNQRDRTYPPKNVNLSVLPCQLTKNVDMIKVGGRSIRLSRIRCCRARLSSPLSTRKALRRPRLRHDSTARAHFSSRSLTCKPTADRKVKQDLKHMHQHGQQCNILLSLLKDKKREKKQCGFSGSTSKWQENHKKNQYLQHKPLKTGPGRVHLRSREGLAAILIKRPLLLQQQYEYMHQYVKNKTSVNRHRQQQEAETTILTERSNGLSSELSLLVCSINLAHKLCIPSTKDLHTVLNGGAQLLQTPFLLVVPSLSLSKLAPDLENSEQRQAQACTQWSLTGTYFT